MTIQWIETELMNAERLITNGQVSEGLKLLNGLLFDEPGYASLHNHVGWAYMYFTDEKSKAEMHLKMAMKFDPGFAPPYVHLGNLYLQQGKLTMAIEVLGEGLKASDPNRFALLETTGRARELRGDFKSAIKVYKQAMLATTVDFEVNNLRAGIKRCRKKRLAFLFTF